MDSPPRRRPSTVMAPVWRPLRLPGATGVLPAAKLSRPTHSSFHASLGFFRLYLCERLASSSQRPSCSVPVRPLHCVFFLSRPAQPRTTTTLFWVTEQLGFHFLLRHPFFSLSSKAGCRHTGYLSLPEVTPSLGDTYSSSWRNGKGVLKITHRQQHFSIPGIFTNTYRIQQNRSQAVGFSLLCLSVSCLSLSLSLSWPPSPLPTTNHIITQYTHVHLYPCRSSCPNTS